MDPEGTGRATGFVGYKDAIQTRGINPTGFKEHYNSMAIRAAFDAFNSGARLSDPPSLLGCLTPHPCSARNNAHLNRRHSNTYRRSARPDQRPRRTHRERGPGALPQRARLACCIVARGPTWAQLGSRTNRRSRRQGLCKGAQQPAIPKPATGTRGESLARASPFVLVGSPHDDKRPRLLPILRVRHEPRPRPHLQVCVSNGV